MASSSDQTIWQLDIQPGDSQATLDAFVNSLSVVKDQIAQVGAAGENFQKLQSFQTKAAEAAAKLEVAQAQAALAIQRAQEAANGGTASAEEIALAQAKAGLAAQKVESAQNNLGVAMGKVQSEGVRLSTVMQENAEAMAAEANKCESLGKIFTFLKESAQSAASGIQAGFEGVQTVIGTVSEKVTEFAQNVRANMESARTEIVETEEATTESSGGMLSGIKSSFGGIIGGASEIGFALMGVQMGFQMVKGAIDSVVGPAESYQQILKQTNDVLTSTKGAAGESAKAITDLATSLGKTTFYNRDVVQSGENVLLTFTNIGKNIFPQATQATLNLSKAMGQDVKSSAVELGKALNDPITGITALQRVGVTFTAQQKEQIKVMQAAGNMAGAQGIILKELNKEFGGSADATKTFAGQWQILSDQFNDFKENIGMAVMPVLQQLMGFINGAIMPVLQSFSSFIQDRVTPVITAFGAYIQNNIFPILVGWGNIIKTWVLDKLNDLHKFIDTNIMPKLTQLWSFIQSKILPVLESWGHNIQVYALDKLNDLKKFIDVNILPTLQAWGHNIQVYVLDKLQALKEFFDKSILPKLLEFWSFVQNKIIPVLQDWGHNIETWALGKLGDLKTFIDQQVLPKLGGLHDYINSQIIPTLQSWGNNIKTWAIDKFNDLKSFIETQVLPKLQAFWNYIQTQIVPILITWGNNIRSQVLAKLQELKTYIESQLIPKLQELWSWIQTNVVSAFSNWGDKIKNVQDNINNLKTFIDTQVIPKLQAMWSWIQVNIVPIFQALANVISNDVAPNFDSFKKSVGNLMDSLNHLWQVIAPVVLPILSLLGITAGSEVSGQFGGLTNAIRGAGTILDLFMKGVTITFNGMAMWINWIADAVNWIENLGAAINKLPSQAVSFVASHIPKFDSGVENFPGGLAYIHAKEMLVNLPKGVSVWNPDKTAQFMQGLKMPTASLGQTFPSTSPGGDQQTQLLQQMVAYLAQMVQLQQQRQGNISMHANVAAGSMNGQLINQLVQSLGGFGYESQQRGVG